VGQRLGGAPPCEQRLAEVLEQRAELGGGRVWLVGDREPARGETLGLGVLVAAEVEPREQRERVRELFVLRAVTLSRPGSTDRIQLG